MKKNAISEHTSVNQFRKLMTPPPQKARPAHQLQAVYAIDARFDAIEGQYTSAVEGNASFNVLTSPTQSDQMLGVLANTSELKTEAISADEARSSATISATFMTPPFWKARLVLGPKEPHPHRTPPYDRLRSITAFRSGRSDRRRTMTELFYGPHEIRLSDNDDLNTLLNRLQNTVNSGKAEWIEIGGENHRNRLLIRPGIPILVRESKSSAYESPCPVIL